MAKGNRGSKQEDVTPNEELPTFKALSLVRVQDGWSVLTLSIQGDKVLNVESTPADMRAIAIEAFRMAFTRLFIWG